MIGRIYADNFRCLTNFELELDQTNIFLGPNGSGKTSVFDALRKIQNLTVRGARIEDEFPQRDLSCLRSDNQVLQFELEIVVDQDSYEYMLQMKHNLDRNRLWIDQEILSHDKKPLFVHEKGIARLYRDDYGRESSYQFDLTRSGIGFLHAHPDNKKLTRFKRELANMMIVSPCPPLFKSECSTVTRTEAVHCSSTNLTTISHYGKCSRGLRKLSMHAARPWNKPSSFPIIRRQSTTWRAPREGGFRGMEKGPCVLGTDPKLSTGGLSLSEAIARGWEE